MNAPRPSQPQQGQTGSSSGDGVRRLIQLQEQHNRLIAEMRSLDYWVKQIESISYWRMFSAITKLMLVLVPSIWIASFVLLVIIGIVAALVQAMTRAAGN
mgnify:CR=1 FL=1